MPRTDILERKEEILQWIQNNESKAFICKQLKCKPETLNSYLEKMNIEYKGNQGLKGKFDQKNNNQYIKAEEYIKSTCVKSSILKQKLIKDGIKQYECEICHQSKWLDQLIPLELHHKDGNHYNNSFDNLQILCPNCHALQNGNSGSNIGTYTKILKEDQNILKNYCIDCGTEISNKATRCKSCAAKELYKEQIKNRPTREELKKLIRTTPFVQIGKMYGVSDNAIRKWCNVYNLPRTVSEIKQYSEEEWNKI